MLFVATVLFIAAALVIATVLFVATVLFIAAALVIATVLFVAAAVADMRWAGALIALVLMAFVIHSALEVI